MKESKQKKKNNASAQQNKLRIRTFVLSGKLMIHQLRGRMSNMYVLEQRRGWLRRKPGRLILVDLGLPEETKALVDYVKSINGEVHEIFFTHVHHDHIGDIKYVRKEFPNALISSTFHADDAMDRRTSRMLKQMPTAVGLLLKKKSQLSIFARFLKSRFESNGKLTGFYENGDLLHSMKNFVVIETPGHTAHDASLYSRRHGVLLSGDTFVRARGRQIIPLSYRAECPDLQGDTVAKLRKLKISYFLPGTGSGVIARDRKERKKLQHRITMPSGPEKTK